ncbi:hypothetical protein PCL_02579 [Purpureocillium lilacinum]|uniref:Zn(2)-C6 fungal-type domain-containing protein n=1 Tax=Purpureocillium lilacinum TaxID=33203 RepID=A0A2U3DZH5_PURLI|nr:hypothetical protein PCL_02579 [Purpureocillium lilacinum]
MMKRARVSRSKTGWWPYSIVALSRFFGQYIGSADWPAGCLSCRRRKVRCDELKPICSACNRLELPCSFRLGDAADFGKTRYRVRFVTSSYSKLQAGSSDLRNAGNACPERRQQPTSGASKDGCSTSCARTPTHLSDVHPDNPPDGSCQASPEADSTLSVGDAGHESQVFEQNGPIPEADRQEPGIVWGEDINSIHIPSYFDLNLNFDSLSEQWPVSYGTFADPSAPNGSFYEDSGFGTVADDRTVIIEPADHNLIQHYLNVMTQYTKMRSSGDESIYTQIFSNMALFHPPLYHATMAWTGLHLGQSKDEPELIENAESRYSHAVSLVHQDRDAWQHFELSLVTIWFALQYELLAARGIESFCRHLEFVADLVDAHGGTVTVDIRQPLLGPIGARVLMWLGSYDARASWIGGSGRLLRNLELFRSSCNILDAACPAKQPGPDAMSLEVCLRLTLEFDTVDNKIAHLHRRSVGPPAAIWAAVQSDLLFLQRRLENSDSISSTLASILQPQRIMKAAMTTKLFNDLLLLSTFYSLIISFHRILPFPTLAIVDPELLTAEEAATRIVRAAAWVIRLKKPSPQNIWPRILFMAGIETIDPLYQDWVVQVFRDAKPWGGNYCKTLTLLEKVIERQSMEGVRVDYVEVMKESVGIFII